MDENKDLIVLVLDKSGSMFDTWSDATGAVKQFLKDQVGLEGRTTDIRFGTFDTYVRLPELYIDATSKTVDSIKFPKPGGGTALLDAIGKHIYETGVALAATPVDKRPSNVYFVVMTDGEENSSREYSKGTIGRMIKEQETVYNWKFVFLGADQDAIAVAKDIGFNPHAAASFSSQKYGQTLNVTTNVISRSRLAGGQSVSYTDEERSAIV